MSGERSGGAVVVIPFAEMVELLERVRRAEAERDADRERAEFEAQDLREELGMLAADVRAQLAEAARWREAAEDQASELERVRCWVGEACGPLVPHERARNASRKLREWAGVDE